MKALGKVPLSAVSLYMKGKEANDLTTQNPRRNHFLFHLDDKEKRFSRGKLSTLIIKKRLLKKSPKNYHKVLSKINYKWFSISYFRLLLYFVCHSASSKTQVVLLSFQFTLISFSFDHNLVFFLADKMFRKRERNKCTKVSVKHFSRNLFLARPISTDFEHFPNSPSGPTHTIFALATLVGTSCLLCVGSETRLVYHVPALVL